MNPAPRCSVCFPTFDHAPLLVRTLESIFAQHPPFEFEVIVTDDGSTDETPAVLSRYPQIRLMTLPRKENWRSPSVPFNIALRQARGQIIIWHTDDIIHGSGDTIERLCNSLKPRQYVVAACKAVKPTEGQSPSLWPIAFSHDGWYIHSKHRRLPHTFLGAYWRQDIYAVGGMDERFISYGFDDDWLETRLARHGIQPEWHDEILGYHQDHRTDNRQDMAQSRELYEHLCAEGKFTSDTGPWPYEPT
jgi:glycosyltransferase involved in cell wall biosynthesis